MKIEAITVELRLRTAWESVELGSALVRRHAGAIWTPWLWLTLPILVLVNALCWAIDTIWLAAFVMWWLKPLFDRVPLYVLSRAVFGDVPTSRQTLRASLSWGARWWLPYLTWRRLSPVRSVFMPVDLLEGGHGDEARQRRHALGSPVYGVGALLTLIFLHFEWVVVLGVLANALLFSPSEYLGSNLFEKFSQIAQKWQMLAAAHPTVGQFAINAVAWFATTLIEPFFVGAGFGLYLNRRTQIEAWDIELVLRRLRKRLTAAATPALLVLALFVGFAPDAAAQNEPEQRPAAPACKADWDAATDDDVEDAMKSASTLQEVFGKSWVDDGDLQQAVKRAYEDPKISPKRTVTRWQPKNRPDKPEMKPPPLEGLGKLFALIGEYGLWVVFGVLVLVLLITAPRWWRWLRDTAAREGREPLEIQRDALPSEAPLPDDVPTVARRLWREGHQRDALALLYRASVAAMTQRAHVVLVPGATEAHTLRASRQMPSAEDRDVFARTVRTWQMAAYAHGLPTAEEFDALLAALTQRFAWSTGPAPRDGAAP